MAVLKTVSPFTDPLKGEDHHQGSGAKVHQPLARKQKRGKTVSNFASQKLQWSSLNTISRQ